MGMFSVITVSDYMGTQAVLGHFTLIHTSLVIKTSLGKFTSETHPAR